MQTKNAIFAIEGNLRIGVKVDVVLARSGHNALVQFEKLRSVICLLGDIDSKSGNGESGVRVCKGARFSW